MAKIKAVVLLVSGLAGGGEALADPAMYKGSEYITLPVLVQFPDNSPAADTTITLQSMDRYMLSSGLADFDWAPVITDSHGFADLRYPVSVESVSDHKREHSILPIYATIDPAENHAGAVIALPVHRRDETTQTIHINRGYTFSGEIAGPDGIPLADHIVSINHDLKAQSHTGYGGKIWKRETRTDAGGRFVFHHVNNNAVTISLAGSGGFYWADTFINGVQKYDCVDEYQPEWNNSGNHIKIIMEKSPAKVYQGTAVDEAGNPVAGARVTIGFSWHRKERTWSDTHSWNTTKTLTDGSWSLGVPTKWATWGEIRQPGKRGPQDGTAYIAARGPVKLSVTAPQVVTLTPDDGDDLMPAGE